MVFIQWIYCSSESFFEIQLPFCNRNYWISPNILKDTIDDDAAPHKSVWPLSWVSSDPAMLRDEALSAFHRCGICDVFMVGKKGSLSALLKSKASTSHGPEEFIGMKWLLSNFLAGVFEHGVISVLDNTPIDCYYQEQVPHGPWIKAASGRTNKGFAQFELPKEIKNKPGRYPLRMVRSDNISEVAIGSLFVVAPGTKAVCFDIDGMKVTCLVHIQRYSHCRRSRSYQAIGIWFY